MRVLFVVLAVKRLMREACELQEATEEYWAHPIDDNLFEWHFTVQGPTATDFAGGVYHGRVMLPAEYPMKPPNIILLTVNNLQSFLDVQPGLFFEAVGSRNTHVHNLASK